jgi:hypothetical protein
VERSQDLAPTLEAAPGVDVSALMAAVRERATIGPRLVIRPNHALREASMEIFECVGAVQRGGCKSLRHRGRRHSKRRSFSVHA